MTFQKLNIYFGWAAFLVALIVYALTVEPTASFWDCGEFIACAYKLEVPHPPGAPFFLLMGRMFSLLSFGEVTQVAYWINMLSVLSSAFAILFLFWSITHLGKKMLGIKDEEVTLTQKILLLGAGFIGAMACTFSDSFWFSAVEAEVYGMSSFFTAFVFWAILKWENKTSESDRARWLILIAYMMGLSIGVHLLNLVTIPVLGLIVYFNYYKEVTAKGVIFTLLISAAILLLIMVGVIPGLPSVAMALELFFVNSLGLPFNSGIAFFGLAFLGVLVYGIIWSIKKEKYILNTVLLGFAFVLIGYSSYSIVLIRSNYNPPIDQNNPEDAVKFLSYLKREQYGSRPLFHGQYYTAQLLSQEPGGNVWMRGEDEYVVKDVRIENTYDPEHTTILPRMYSSDPGHVQEYQRITGLSQGEKPSFADNLAFMFRHQLGHMYLRYFLWNFSGRQSDIQNAPSVKIADTGAPEFLKQNKAHNVYYMIPLIFGFIGIYFQYKKNKKYFAATLLLFFLTGAALVLYLNSPPIEPRERDYIYTGSYYVFCIWIGMSVFGLFELFSKVIKDKKFAAIIACLLALGTPVILAAENWDDHDRSDRYFSIESARNYLESCAPNAILFTGGDNDTFPLWYLQEVEGVRRDVRVVVLSYFNTDWYVEQMMRQAYESDPLPFSLTAANYRSGSVNDYLPVREDHPYFGVEGLAGRVTDLKRYLTFARQNSKSIQIKYTDKDSTNSVPTRTLGMSNIDTAKVKAMLPAYLHDYVVPQMALRIKGKDGRGLEKKDLAILDLIVNSQWERPIYFNNTSLRHFNVEVMPHVIQEGLTYRFLPVQATNQTLVNREVTYENVMEKFKWTNLDDPEVYYTEDYRSFCRNTRSVFNVLAQSYLDVGDKQTARELLLFNLEVMPHESIPYDPYSAQQVRLLMDVGEEEKAKKMAETIVALAEQKLDAATGEFAYSAKPQEELLTINVIVSAFRNSDEKELANKYEQIFTRYAAQMQVGGF